MPRCMQGQSRKEINFIKSTSLKEKNIFKSFKMVCKGSFNITVLKKKNLKICLRCLQSHRHTFNILYSTVTLTSYIKCSADNPGREIDK